MADPLVDAISSALAPPKPAANSTVSRALLNAATEEKLPSIVSGPAPGLQEKLDDFNRRNEGPAWQYGDAPSYWGGFLKTMIHGGTSGLIGRDADEAFFDPEAVARFSAENPKSALLAEVIGSAPAYLLPYIGEARGASLGLRVAKALPGLAKVATAAEALTNPIAKAAAMEMVKVAPLEVARAVGAALDLKKEGTLPKVLGQIAFEEPLFGIFGGAAAALRGALPAAGRLVGEEQKLQNAFKFYNLNGSYQERLRQAVHAEDLLRQAPEGEINQELSDVITGVKSKLQDAILEEQPSGRNAHVQSLANDDKRFASKGLNALFKADSESVKARSFGDGGGYSSVTDASKDMASAGLVRDQLHYTQYPRSVEALDVTGGERIKNLLKSRAFTAIRKKGAVADTWIAKENEGAFVVIQRIKNAERRTGAGAKYVMFKTDAPMMFHPQAANLEKAALRVFRPLMPPPYTAAERGIKTMERIRRIVKGVGPEPEELLGVPNRPVKDYLMSKLSAEKKATAEALGRRVDHFSSELKRVLSPGLVEGSVSKRYMRLASGMRAVFNDMNSEVQRLFHGTKAPSVARSAVGQLSEVPKFSKGIADAIDALSQKAMNEVTWATMNEVSLREAAKAGLSDEARGFLRMLKELDRSQVAETLRLHNYARDLGYLDRVPEFAPREWHYGISRTWRGDFRVPITDAEGNLVGRGSGYTAAQAVDDADALVRAAAKLGEPELKAGRTAERFTRDQDIAEAMKIGDSLPGVQSIRKARAAIASTPPERMLRTRTGLQGAMGQFAPFSKQELKDILLANITETQRRNTLLGLHIAMGPEIYEKLAKEYPQLAKDLIQRINVRGGLNDPEAFAAKINKASDKVFGPYFGNNSAGQIVRILNRGMFNLTFGLLHMGFAAVNAVTPIITGLPEAALVLTGLPERMGKYYGTAAAWDAARGLRSWHSLDPLKVLYQGGKTLFSKDPEFGKLMERALMEGVTDPKFVEEFTGQLQTRLFGKGKSWTDFLLAVSEWPASKSEEFSRGLSLAMGYNMGKDVLGLSGEQLYQFSREFVERTQFLYTAADRSRIFTGPLGSLVGLFKNWSMHQLSMLAQYHGEAFLSGNMAPLLWSNLGAGLIAGAQGAPTLGALNQMSKVFSDKSLLLNVHDALGYDDDTPQGYLSDFFFYGFPGLFGLSLQSQAASAGSDPIHDLSQLTSVAAWDRMVWANEFVGKALDYSSHTGQSPFQSQEVRDAFIRASMPRTLYRFLQVSGDGAIRSLKTQGKLMSGLSVPDRVLYSLGLQPNEVDKFFEVDNYAWASTQARHDAIDTLGAALSDAQLNGDVAGQTRVLRSALQQGVLDSVIRSAKGRYSVRTQDQLERQWKDENSQKLGRMVGVTGNTPQ